MCITEVLLRNPILFCYSSISTFILLQYIVTPERGERRGGEERGEERGREERRGGERRGEEERGEEERGEEEREERRGQNASSQHGMFHCSYISTFRRCQPPSPPSPLIVEDDLHVEVVASSECIPLHSDLQYGGSTDYVYHTGHIRLQLVDLTVT